MKQLLLALVSLFFASSAYSAPIRYGFFQGGYHEGAFVAGSFVVDNRHDPSLIRHGAQESGQGSGDLVEYFMFFSGNSRVPAFTHVGLDVFNLWVGADIDNLTGVYWDTRSSLLPTGEFLPPECNPHTEECTSVPFGFIRAENWVSGPNFERISRGFRWTAGYIPGSNRVCTGGSGLPCGEIVGDPEHGGGTTTAQVVHVFRISEPGTLSLLGLALAGLAVIRRRGDSHRITRSNPPA